MYIYVGRVQEESVPVGLATDRESASKITSGISPHPLVTVNAIRDYIEKSGADSAFFHVNLSEIVRQYMRWTNELPWVTPYYAVKCNNDSRILTTLADLGCNFDCASASEIQSVLSSVSPQSGLFMPTLARPPHSWNTHRQTM